MGDEPRLTTPVDAPSGALATPAEHGHALPASRPPDAYVPLRRWVLDSAAQLRTMRGDLREQLAASAPTFEDDGTAPDSVVLVTSELATNALAHGQPPAQVRLLLDGSAVLVVVSDTDTTHVPFLAEGRAPGDGGFGLQIAQRLSADVGWWADAGGKHVWATFEIERSA